MYVAQLAYFNDVGNPFPAEYEESESEDEESLNGSNLIPLPCVKGVSYAPAAATCPMLLMIREFRSAGRICSSSENCSVTASSTCARYEIFLSLY